MYFSENPDNGSEWSGHIPFDRLDVDSSVIPDVISRLSRFGNKI
jgi:hypothetical protein